MTADRCLVRILSADRDVLASELERLSVPADARAAAVVRERRLAVAIFGIAADALPPLLAAARAQGLRLFSAAPRALLVGPAVLIREVARDLPAELGGPLGAALDRCRRPQTLRLRHARGILDLSRPAVMGIVNVTPDSFSEQGETFEAGAAIARGRRLASEGAAIIDIGGESTRPGAAPVPLAEELRRVIPVVTGLSSLGVPLSIDTRKAEVAARALASGASIVNDVAGLEDPRMRAAVAASGAGVVIMHMRGTPESMQDAPRYDDLLEDVARFLAERAGAALGAGVPADAVAVDPGIGFGKTAAHNLEILRRLDEICSLGFPLLVGISRKSTLGAVTGRPPAERAAAGFAAAALAVAKGASIIRTHDVAGTVDAVAMAEATLGGRPTPSSAG